MNEMKLKTLLWMRHLLVVFMYNTDPKDCWEKIMMHIILASPKTLEEDKNSPLQGIDQKVVSDFAKGYVMAIAKYKDTKTANEKMRDKIKDTLMKNLGYSEEELMKDIKILHAKSDLMINGIHIDNTDPITNN